APRRRGRRAPLAGPAARAGAAPLARGFAGRRMMSKRETILAALTGALRTGLSANVRRNEVLPEKVPAEGLVILRDGDPGEPDVTLNPRTEFYSHRVEIEAYVPRDPD